MEHSKKTLHILILKPLDCAIIAAVIVLSVLSLLFVPHGGDTVTITEHGKVIYSDYLYKDVSITTTDGNNVIIIENGMASMQSANCNDHTCMKMGYATAQKPIACLPNEVMIIITNSDNDLDGVAH